MPTGAAKDIPQQLCGEDHKEAAVNEMLRARRSRCIELLLVVLLPLLRCCSLPCKHDQAGPCRDAAHVASQHGNMIPQHGRNLMQGSHQLVDVAASEHGSSLKSASAAPWLHAQQYHAQHHANMPDTKEDITQNEHPYKTDMVIISHLQNQQNQMPNGHRSNAGSGVQPQLGLPAALTSGSQQLASSSSHEPFQARDLPSAVQSVLDAAQTPAANSQGITTTHQDTYGMGGIVTSMADDCHDGGSGSTHSTHAPLAHEAAGRYHATAASAHPVSSTEHSTSTATTTTTTSRSSSSSAAQSSTTSISSNTGMSSTGNTLSTTSTTGMMSSTQYTQQDTAIGNDMNAAAQAPDVPGRKYQYYAAQIHSSHDVGDASPGIADGASPSIASGAGPGIASGAGPGAGGAGPGYGKGDGGSSDAPNDPLGTHGAEGHGVNRRQYADHVKPNEGNQHGADELQWLLHEPPDEALMKAARARQARQLQQVISTTATILVYRMDSVVDAGSSNNWLNAMNSAFPGKALQVTRQPTFSAYPSVKVGW